MVGGVEAGVGVKEGHGRMRGLRECVCACGGWVGGWGNKGVWQEGEETPIETEGFLELERDYEEGTR